MKYFALVLLIGVFTFLSCTDSSTENPMESSKNQNAIIKPTVIMTVHGKVEFSDGTVYESLDQPKNFAMPEKYIGKVTQIKKVTNAPEYELIFNLFSGGEMLVYGSVIMSYWFGVDYARYGYIGVNASGFAGAAYSSSTIACNANIIDDAGWSIDKRLDWSNAVNMTRPISQFYTNLLLMTEGYMSFSQFEGQVQIVAEGPYSAYKWVQVYELNYHFTAATHRFLP